MRLATVIATLALVWSVGCTQNLSGGNGACDEGLTDCTGTCVNLDTDSNNCGACGTTCQGGQTCVAGVCELVCPQGEINCGGQCVDPQTNNQYCGATGDCAGGNTGETCMGNETCDSGACGCNGDGYFECVPGTCTNLNMDDGNCGACFNQCPSNAECMSGTCVFNTITAGALPPDNGRWDYSGTIGIPGADTLCDMSFPGSGACDRSEVEAAAAAAELIGLMDTNGTTVTQMWIDDPNAGDALRCVDTNQENIPWSYETGHIGGMGQSVTLDNALGTIGAITTTACNSGGYHTLCCY